MLTLLSLENTRRVASYRIEVEEQEQKSLVEYMNLLSYHFIVSIVIVEIVIAIISFQNHINGRVFSLVSQIKGNTT